MPANNTSRSLNSNRNPAKVTRFQINSKREKSFTKKIIPPWNEPIPENPNRVVDSDEDVASNVDEALHLFKEINNQERNPHMTEEKIIKSEKKAYQNFEYSKLYLLKEKNPHMRHPQLMNLVAKLWRRAPENMYRRFWRSAVIVLLVLKEINKLFQIIFLNSICPVCLF